MDPSQENDTNRHINVLNNHEAILELLSLMKEKGRKWKAVELSHLILSIDKIDSEYRALYDDLTDQKNELEKLVAECAAVGVDTSDIDISEYQVTQQEAEQFVVTMGAVKRTIIDWAKSSVSFYKLVGVSALDAAMSTTNIRNTRNTLRKLSYGSALGVLATTLIASIERDSSSFRAVFLIPLQIIKEMLSKANNAAYATLGGVEHLKQTAEVVQEVQAERSLAKKPSIRQDLEERKAQIAARPVPDKTTERQTDRPGLLGRGG